MARNSQGTGQMCQGPGIGPPWWFKVVPGGSLCNCQGPCLISICLLPAWACLVPPPSAHTPSFRNPTHEALAVTVTAITVTVST